MTAYPDGFTFQEYRHARALVQRDVAQIDSVRARRLARIIAGGAGVFGAVVTAASMLDLTPWAPPLVLAASVVGAPAIYVVSRPALRVARPSVPFRSEGWSLGLPLVATILLAPLSMHAVFAAVTGALDAQSFASQLAGFTTWMRLSGAIVGHAHLALAALALRYVGKLRKRSLEEMAVERAGTAGVKDALVTAAIAAVPGIVLLAVPPLLVLVTGIVFVPIAYEITRRTLLRERELLARYAAAADRAPGIDELEAARAELG